MQINDYDATKSITTDATTGSPGADTLANNPAANTLTNDEVISTLNNLIETCKDGQEGFRQASEGVENSNLKSLFSEYSAQRAQFAGELQTLVRDLGGDPETTSSTAGAIHRGWINIKSAIMGQDETAVLNECERGEDVAKNAYKDALAQNLPFNVADVVQRQANEVQAAHDQIKALRDTSRGAQSTSTATGS